MYVNNANYVRPNSNVLHAQRTDLDYLKACAEARMAAFDKLPKEARLAIHEYGQLKAAVVCKSRKAADKVKAVRMAYVRKLEKSATLID